MMHVVCAVEVGWRGMRECSTVLGRSGAAVEVLIKGDVEPAVLGMITRRPGVTIRAVAARRFAWTLACRLLSADGGAADTRLLIVNKSKTARWTSVVGRLRRWRVLRLEETEQGYRFFDATGRETLVPLLENITSHSVSAPRGDAGMPTEREDPHRAEGPARGAPGGRTPVEEGAR